MSAEAPEFIKRLEAQRVNPPEVTEDKLKLIRAKAQEAIQLTLQKKELELQVNMLNSKYLAITQKELPDLMTEAGTDALGVEAEGNIPALDVKAKPYYHANIKNEDETAGEAYAWLEDHGAGSLIKTTFTINFGMGEEKEVAKFEKLLAKDQVSFETKLGVPWGTLTAFFKERVEQHALDEKVEIPPLHLINGKIGRIVEIKERKEKAPQKASTKTNKY